MAGLSENGTTPPPEPPNGLAHDRALEEKFTAAALRTRARNAELDARGLSRNPLKRAAELEAARVGVAVEHGPVERIPVEEGDPPVSVLTKERRQWLVPERFQEVTFDSFEARTPSQSMALEAVRQWVGRTMRRTGPMLALIGSQGAGKSHLLYAAVSQLLEVVPSDVYARPWYRLADELRYGGPSVFAPTLRDEPNEVRDRLWKHRIVLIDEVRPTASTAFDDTELAKFACHAYDARVAVLITTNIDPLKDVMGAPAASRFTQLVIAGPDRRQQ